MFNQKLRVGINDRCYTLCAMCKGYTDYLQRSVGRARTAGFNGLNFIDVFSLCDGLPENVYDNVNNCGENKASGIKKEHGDGMQCI